MLSRLAPALPRCGESGAGGRGSGPGSAPVRIAGWAASEQGDAETAQRVVRAHITGYYADAGLPDPSDA